VTLQANENEIHVIKRGFHMAIMNSNMYNIHTAKHCMGSYVVIFHELPAYSNCNYKEHDMPVSKDDACIGLGWAGILVHTPSAVAMGASAHRAMSGSCTL